MAPESPSSSWDDRERRHKYRNHSPELNLNQSLNHHDEYKDDDDERFEDLDRRAQTNVLEENHHDQRQFMDGDYEDDVRDTKHIKRHSKNRGYESSRAVTGLDLNVGQASSPELPPPPSSSSKLLHSPNSRHALPSPPLPLPSSRRDRSRSRSPPAASAVGQGRKSPPPSFSDRRRSSHRKQHSPRPASGIRSPHPAVSRHQQQPGSSPPSKRARLPSRQRSSPMVDDRQRQEQVRQYSPAPVRRQDPATEPAVSRRRSPYVAEERRLPARKRSSPVAEDRQQQVQQRQYSPSPVRRRDPSAEPVVARRRSPYVVEDRRLPARKRSPVVEDRQQQIQQRQYSPSPVRRQDPPAEPTVARRRSPYVVEERRRSVTPLRKPLPSEDLAAAKLGPFNDERGQRRSVTPLRRRPPSVEAGSGARGRYPLSTGDRRPRSVTPLRTRAPPPEETGRKVSPIPSGERKRHSVEDGPRKKERSRTPIHHREVEEGPRKIERSRTPIHRRELEDGPRKKFRSRTPILDWGSRSRSPMPRRSPSPAPPSRRTRSPPPRRRSPRRSPRRERSPAGRASPRRRSSPSRYRGSRRDRRSSPAGRRGWSPVQNRSNGVGKPGNNLFIAGFNFITTERDLERKFSRYGRVMDVRIVRDKRSGESRGFGFLTLERDEDADAAIKALDQTEWNGRIVLVEKAKTPTRF